MEQELREFFKTIGRGRLKKIWQQVKAGKVNDLESEDRRYADLMEEHKDEYFEAFEKADDRHLDPDADTDAYLHVSFHRMVEQQLDDSDPIEAVQLYNALRGKRVSHHDAVHLLAAVFIPFMFDVLKTGGEFDQEGYRRLLKKAKGRKPEKIWDMLDREVYDEDLDGGAFPEGVYRLRIELEDIDPPVWRRILIPAGATFRDLHAAIQVAMGWEDAHLHRFEVRDPNTGQKTFIGRPLKDDGWEDNVRPGWQYGISDFIGPETPQCRYVYDYGDNWTHRIRLEETLPSEPEKTYPVCLEGERACPPEDVGGPAGYEDLLGILQDPRNERYEEILEMIGDFDPEHFVPAEVVFTSPDS
ncbi:MAG: plasmid pRiA4b ORF-3 family protein [Desulfobacterales bacterium]|nr:plasmid pRiA4b ORF-3 family protein [Desulfobacterales bacterium]